MFLIKIYIKESYINYYYTIIQMCGQYCILAPILHTTMFAECTVFAQKKQLVSLDPKIN